MIQVKEDSNNENSNNKKVRRKKWAYLTYLI